MTLILGRVNLHVVLTVSGININFMWLWLFSYICKSKDLCTVCYVIWVFSYLFGSVVGILYYSSIRLTLLYPTIPGFPSLLADDQTEKDQACLYLPERPWRSGRGGGEGRGAGSPRARSEECGPRQPDQGKIAPCSIERFWWGLCTLF